MEANTIAAVIMFFDALIAAFFALVTGTVTSGPYSSTHPYAGFLAPFLLLSASATVSGILILTKKRPLFSTACVIFTLISATIAITYLGSAWSGSLSPGLTMLIFPMFAMFLMRKTIGKR
jgi:hypothetical protein